MQSRHLLKLVNKMNESENLYCFSGTYLKDYDNGGKYEVLNDKSIELSNYFSLMANISYSDENKQIMTSFDMENMYALHSFIFKNEILNILKDKELLNLRRAIHLYMSLSAIYKKQDLGAVVSSISCGYTTLAPITEIDNKKYYIDINAESYLDFKRCEGLSLMEMYAIFQKYNLMRFQKSQTKKININNIIELIKTMNLLDEKIKTYKKKSFFAPKKYNKKIEEATIKKQEIVNFLSDYVV